MISAHDFVALMIEHDVLRFGEFTLKSGRQSPYFFNLGAIDDGLGLKVLGEAYADACWCGTIWYPKCCSDRRTKASPLQRRRQWH